MLFIYEDGTVERVVEMEELYYRIISPGCRSLSSPKDVSKGATRDDNGKIIP